jgi:clan AA aspartic protease (TIGR02281 family)
VLAFGDENSVSEFRQFLGFHPHMRVLGLLTISTLLAAPVIISLAAPPSTIAQDHSAAFPTSLQTCDVQLNLPTEGEAALARQDFDTALAFYRDELKRHPGSQEGQLGLVRALVGKDRTAEATEEARKALAGHPNTALAEVAAGEAAYRNADFESMRAHAVAAVLDNPCGGRGLALFARYNSLFAMFATEARLLSDAHRLRPHDELILRAWIQSLPRRERTIELGIYLNSRPALSPRDRDDLINVEDHLKARRADECRITTKADAIHIPFVPVYGDATKPVAYGLDVAFNGKHRKMQVDTGASGIVLTAAAAKRLGLEPEFRTHASGVGDSGEIDSYLTHVANIRIGELEVSDCLVEVLQQSTLQVDGLIGIDVFDRWLVTLDFQSAQLRLNPLPPRPGAQTLPSTAPLGRLNSSGSASQQDADIESIPRDAVVLPDQRDWLRVARIGPDLLLQSSVNGGPKHYMIADTGADQTLLSLPLAEEVGQPREDPTHRITGISGNVKTAYRIESATLQFGQLRLPSTAYSALDLTGISHDAGVEVSGLIGLPTLSRLTIVIDYRDNLVQLKYDPKRDVQLF